MCSAKNIVAHFLLNESIIRNGILCINPIISEHNYNIIDE